MCGGNEWTDLRTSVLLITMMHLSRVGFSDLRRNTSQSAKNILCIINLFQPRGSTSVICFPALLSSVLFCSLDLIQNGAEEQVACYKLHFLCHRLSKYLVQQILKKKINKGSRQKKGYHILK